MLDIDLNERVAKALTECVTKINAVSHRCPCGRCLLVAAEVYPDQIKDMIAETAHISGFSVDVLYEKLYQVLEIYVDTANVLAAMDQNSLMSLFEFIDNLAGGSDHE